MFAPYRLRKNVWLSLGLAEETIFTMHTPVFTICVSHALFTSLCRLLYFYWTSVHINYGNLKPNLELKVKLRIAISADSENKYMMHIKPLLKHIISKHLIITSESLSSITLCIMHINTAISEKYFGIFSNYLTPKFKGLMNRSDSILFRRTRECIRNYYIVRV